jgi:flagellar motor protein MotB
MTDDAPADEAPEEESYFVSMTDILVGLLFIFIIMLMTFALQFRDAEAAKNKETRTIQSADELAEAAKRRLLTDVESYLQQRGVKVTVDLQQGVIRLPESVLFERARAELDADGEAALSHVAAALAEALPCYAADRPIACPGPRTAWLDALFIEGHTDDDPLRAGARYRDNFELSALRAVNTYRELVDPDPVASEPDRQDAARLLLGLRNRRGEPILAFSGYGDQRPIADNRDPVAKAQNRRIDLRFLMATLRPPELKALANDLQRFQSP